MFSASTHQPCFEGINETKPVRRLASLYPADRVNSLTNTAQRKDDEKAKTQPSNTTDDFTWLCLVTKYAKSSTPNTVRIIPSALCFLLILGFPTF